MNDLIDSILDFTKGDKLSGVYLAKPTGKVLADDKTFIQISYGGTLQYAKPSMPFGWFFIPTEEWLEKHKTTIGIWIIFEHGNPRYPVWLGIAPLDEKIPGGNYPNIAEFKTETFTQVFDDVDSIYSLKHDDNFLFILAKNYISLLNKDEYGLHITKNKVQLGKKSETKTEAVRFDKLKEVIEDILELVVKMLTISPMGNNSTGEIDPATVSRKAAIIQKLNSIKSNSVELD